MISNAPQPGNYNRLLVMLCAVCFSIQSFARIPSEQASPKINAVYGTDYSISQNGFFLISEDSLQNVEAAQFLKHTQVAIAKARKYEKANNLAPSENLAVAERLAAHAKTLLDANNFQDAITCSDKARELAIQAIASYDNKETADKYATFSTEQTPFIQDILSSDTTSLSYWIVQIN